MLFHVISSSEPQSAHTFYWRKKSKTARCTFQDGSRCVTMGDYLVEGYCPLHSHVVRPMLFHAAINDFSFCRCKGAVPTKSFITRIGLPAE